MHLGPEWGETKEGFRCTNKKNSVPRNPKLKWLAAIDKERYPPSYLLGHIKVLVLAWHGSWFAKSVWLECFKVLVCGRLGVQQLGETAS